MFVAKDKKKLWHKVIRNLSIFNTHLSVELRNIDIDINIYKYIVKLVQTFMCI